MNKLILAITLLVLALSTKAQDTTAKKRPLSASLKAGNWVFISGQVGINPKTTQLVTTSFEAELRQVMENLKTQLASHQLNFDDLVSTVIYLTDMNKYDLVNKIYGEYFNQKFPTRTCVAVKELPVKASVEISGIAIAP